MSVEPRADTSHDTHEPSTAMNDGGVARTPIEVRTWPDEATRTEKSPCEWVAEATVDGTRYEVRSRKGAANALARELVTAGVPDRHMTVWNRRGDGEWLLGLQWRSFYRAAEWTYRENRRQPLTRAKYVEFAGDE